MPDQDSSVHTAAQPSRPAEHPHHPDAVSASMGRSCSLHARPHWLPKTLFYREMQEGTRSYGGQKKRFKYTLKISLKAFSTNPDTWEHTVVDRARWCYSIHKDADLCEERRTAAGQQKRQTRKARVSKQEQVSHIPCPSCHRTFRAHIALISHLRIQNHLTTPIPSQP